MAQAALWSNLKRISLPVLVVNSTADSGIWPSEGQRAFDSTASKDKGKAVISGGEHSLQPDGPKAGAGDQRRQFTKIVVEWARQRWSLCKFPHVLRKGKYEKPLVLPSARRGDRASHRHRLRPAGSVPTPQAGCEGIQKDVLYSPGQLEIPQDQSVDYYVDNVYKLRVEGKDQAEVDKAWKAYLKNNVSTGYCFDLYTVPVVDRPIGDKGRVLDVGGKAQLVNVVELAPGKSTEWHSYGFNGEPLYYILQGQGLTEYYSRPSPSLGGMPYKKYSWASHRCSPFRRPSDPPHQHGDDTGAYAAVVGYGVNLFPYVPDENLRAVENAAETDEARAKMMASGGMNAVPYFRDLRQLKLTPREERADSSGFFDVASTAGHRTHPNVHVSQLFRDKTYAHKHDGRPMFVILQGHGHDLWSDANNLEQFREAVSSREGAHHLLQGRWTLRHSRRPALAPALR